MMASKKMAGLFLFMLCAVQAFGGELKPGDPFPFGELEKITKLTPFDASELKNNPTLIVFWASWCPNCKNQMPELDALFKRRQKEGLKVVGISKEDQRANAEAYAKTMSFPQLFDESEKLAKLIGATHIPYMIYIDRAGKVERTILGYGPLNTWRIEQAFLRNH